METTTINKIIKFSSKKFIIIPLSVIFIIYSYFIIDSFPDNKNYSYYMHTEKIFNDWNVIYLQETNAIAMFTRDENVNFAILSSIFDINKYSLQIPTNQKIYTLISLSKNLLTRLPYNRAFNAAINITQNPNIQLTKDPNGILFYDKYIGVYNDFLFDILNTNSATLKIDIPEPEVTLIFSTNGVREAYEYTIELYKKIMQSKNQYDIDYEKWKINLIVFIIVFSIFLLFYCVIFILGNHYHNH